MFSPEFLKLVPLRTGTGFRLTNIKGIVAEFRTREYN